MISWEKIQNVCKNRERDIHKLSQFCNFNCRRYFLNAGNYKDIKRPPGDISSILVQRFGELIRKLWNPKNFKAHVSPHEMLQSVVLCSKKTFQITEQGDSVEFLKWFLNALHLALGGTKKHSSSIIYKTFSGGMRIHSKKILPTELTDDAKKAELLASGEYDWKVTESPFLYLTCELPPPPLFRDEHLNNIIPQVSLFTLLGKFNGETEKEYKTYKDNIIRRFELTRLPPVSIVISPCSLIIILSVRFYVVLISVDLD